MANASVRLGVDIGGTFTDVVLEKNNALHSQKVITTNAAPENAIIEGMKQVCVLADVSLGEIGQIIHGTTLATNALIERKGAKTALITTKGFRDVIEMRTESRFEQYDLNLSLPEALVPRQDRFIIEERIGASGNVLIPIERSKVERLVEEIKTRGFESIAVGLIHSYINDDHEKLVRDVIIEKMPDAMVSLSSEVSPQMREYERFNTVVANAYIKPLMKNYLSRLEGRLLAEGVTCSIFLMHSGGGIISLDNAANFPVRLIESGPAGGVVFAAKISAGYGLEKVLSFDMGGTTAKICLIKNQTPKTNRVFEVARTYRFKKGSGMPISIPVIDMVEIGAGGGSLAHVDSMRQIRVGPKSAGSEPGPACYGRGGLEPTVTDADLVLGKLDPNNFAGGSIQLHLASSTESLDNTFGQQLEMNTMTSAYGLTEVVDENMANAARVHAVENGENLSEYTMIAFGGAAPLHGGRLCEKLGIKRMLVPPGAGVGSAIGFLHAPFSFEANRSLYMKLSEFVPEKVCELLEELQSEATCFVRSCDADATIYSEFKAYMRYSGQGWEIPVILDTAVVSSPSVEMFKRTFEERYTQLFGRVVEGLDLEITVWAVNATTEPEKVSTIKALTRMTDATTEGIRSLFDPAVGEPVNAAIVARKNMNSGQRVQGPSIITEKETTTVVPSSCYALVQPDGCIDVIKASQDHNHGTK